MVQNPPENIDVLICEGTQIGRDLDLAYWLSARRRKPKRRTEGENTGLEYEDDRRRSALPKVQHSRREAYTQEENR